MQVSFPYPVKIQSLTPYLDGMRLGVFTNINGEAFAQPTLNGLWRIDMRVFAHDVQSHLALSSFITQMSAAGATCVVPICTQTMPNDQHGRPLTGCDMAPEYLFDHVGFLGDPFDGFTLHLPAVHRDSFLVINKPALSHLQPGHFISLGERFYQVVKVSNVNEMEDRIMVSVMPNIRGGTPAGTVVIVDQLRLKCMMDRGDQIGLSTDPMKGSSISFVEAF